MTYKELTQELKNKKSQYHRVKGGMYYRSWNGIVSFLDFSDKNHIQKRVIMLFSTNDTWAEIKQER